VERHSAISSLDNGQPELPRVGAKLQQVMVARGYQQFLLSSREHRGLANVPFVAIWFPSSLPLLVRSCRVWVSNSCLYSWMKTYNERLACLHAGLCLQLWTSTTETQDGWQSSLKCLYSLHVGTTSKLHAKYPSISVSCGSAPVSEAGLQLGAEWHGNDLVDQLELPYVTLLELATMLAHTSTWLPPAQRCLRGLTVGYWLL
jgi:hypothetical protein